MNNSTAEESSGAHVSVAAAVGAGLWHEAEVWGWWGSEREEQQGSSNRHKCVREQIRWWSEVSTEVTMHNLQTPDWKTEAYTKGQSAIKGTCYKIWQRVQILKPQEKEKNCLPWALSDLHMLWHRKTHTRGLERRVNVIKKKCLLNSKCQWNGGKKGADSKSSE